jgi:hypothetical protein
MGGKRTEALPLLALLLEFYPIMVKDLDKREFRPQ